MSMEVSRGILHIIEELDMVSYQYFKKLTEADEIWECRISIGRIGYRILCFMDSGSLVILTNGFGKRARKHHPKRFPVPIGIGTTI